jgi:hypothetical protein
MACRWIDGIKTRERRNEGKEEERTVARHVIGPQNKSDEDITTPPPFCFLCL